MSRAQWACRTRSGRPQVERRNASQAVSRVSTPRGVGTHHGSLSPACGLAVSGRRPASHAGFRVAGRGCPKLGSGLRLDATGEVRSFADIQMSP